MPSFIKKDEKKNNWVLINAENANNTLTKLDGSIAENPQSKALINATKTLLYPIEEDIPILLENEAIELKGMVI